MNVASGGTQHANVEVRVLRFAFFGGVYNNYLALDAAIRDARGRGVDRLYCLGDFGAFGPHPDRVFPLLHDAGVVCVQGNYDNSIGNDLDDCQCGYTDPRDNHFAQISYEYTYENTSRPNREWMRGLTQQLQFAADDIRFLLCHGSPRRTNEFLWESTTSTAFLERRQREARADVILATHTGLHWQRPLKRGRRFVNVGVLGRPENDGTTNVWYTIVRTGSDANPDSPDFVQTDNAGHVALDVEFIPVAYDHRRLAGEMRQEGIPEEFVETILTGWWTTCLEILPGRERRRGRF